MLNDLRFALRHLAKHLGFTAVAAFTLGLGIALVSTQYSLIDGVLLRPLPFPDAQRLYHVSRGAQGSGGASWQPVLIDEFLALREQQQSFEKLAAFRYGTFNLVRTGGVPRRLQGNSVSAGFFEALRTPAMLGRVFAPGEDGAGQPLTVVLNHALWREEFAADPAVIGRQVMLNGEAATVIGVMPPGFSFPNRDECWVNLRLGPVPADAADLSRVEAIGLLNPGVEPSAAALELGTIVRRVPQPRAGDEAPATMVVQRIASAYNGDGTVALLGSMLAMTLFVLVLACINVANLLFVRSADRARELALRNALGAGRARVVRQLLVESLVLAALGTALGLALAAVGVRVLDVASSTRMELPPWMHFDLNARVLAFTAAIATVAGLLAGLLPALRAARTDLSSVLREDGHGSVGTRHGRAGRWLIAGQLAFSCGAMVVAALLALSGVRSSRVNLGFDPDSLLIGRIELQAPAYADAAKRTAFYERLLERVRATPGVAAVAVSSRDLADRGVYMPLEVDGASYPRASDKPGAWLEVVSRDYFQVVNRQAVAGQLFGPQHVAGGLPVALVNQSFAARTWPGADPIGRRLRRAEPDAPWATVIGVVPDLNMEGVGNGESGAGWYLLQDQMGWGWLELIVRSIGEPTALVPALRAAVAELDPAQPIHTISTLSERTARRAAPMQIIGTMAAVFAAAALLLAAVGIYGVMAFSARRRMREFGVRIALGSTGARILALLLRAGAAQTLVGIGAGLGIGYLLSRPLVPVLPKVTAGDPFVYVTVALVLGATAMFACWLPARRAAQVDPVVALRGG